MLPKDQADTKTPVLDLQLMQTITAFCALGRLPYLSIICTIQGCL